jgi:hypothetical protein
VWGLLSRDRPADPDLRPRCAEVAREATLGVAALFVADPAAERAGVTAEDPGLEMLAEFVTSGMSGLAWWWRDHRDLTRAAVVEVARAAILPVIAVLQSSDPADLATRAKAPGTAGAIDMAAGDMSATDT